MELNNIIHNFKSIEKLNKTNIHFKTYSINFKTFVQNLDNLNDIFQILTKKSSCFPFILNHILDDISIVDLIEKINFFIYEKCISNKLILNYIINIISIRRIRYLFLKNIKNGMYDSIFSRLINNKFKNISKLNTENYFIIDNLFLKICEDKQGINYFLNILKFTKKRNFYQINDDLMLLNSEEIFNKHIIIILVEIFNKKFSSNFENIFEHSTGKKFLYLLTKIIHNNYINLIEEIRFIKTNQINVERLNQISNLVNNEIYINMIWVFYNNIIFLINKNKCKDKEFLGNILNDIQMFITQNPKTTNDFTNIFKLIHLVFSKEITNNHHLIINYTYICRDKLIDFFSIKRQTFFNYNLSKIVNKCPEILSFIYNKYKDNNDLILDLSVEFCSILNLSLFLHSNYIKLFNNTYKNQTYVKKMILILLENIDICLDHLRNYKTKQSYYNNRYFNILLSIIRFISNMSKKFKKLFISIELKSLFIRVIKRLNNFNSKMNDIDVNYVKYDYKIINNYLYQIIYNLKDYYKIFTEIDLLFLKNNFDVNKNNIDGLVLINKIISNSKKTEIILNHPEKFCDPITNVLIEEPIMLPNKIIVDKSMIYRYLLTNNTNPFDRQKLSRKILDEFNIQEDISKLIEQFKQELIRYKNCL